MSREPPGDVLFWHVRHPPILRLSEENDVSHISVLDSTLVARDSSWKRKYIVEIAILSPLDSQQDPGLISILAREPTCIRRF